MNRKHSQFIIANTSLHYVITTYHSDEKINFRMQVYLMSPNKNADNFFSPH